MDSADSAATLLCVDGVRRAETNGASLYMDEVHLSDQGGERVKPLCELVSFGESAR